MHSMSEEYLNEENIDLYLHKLADEINHAGIGQHKLLIVGGAAMALKYHDGRATVDIDMRGPNLMGQRKISKRYLRK